jgi:hypothetical protein
MLQRLPQLLQQVCSRYNPKVRQTAGDTSSDRSKCSRHSHWQYPHNASLGICQTNVSDGTPIGEKVCQVPQTGKLAEIRDLRVTIHLRHTEEYSNAQIKKDIVVATRGLQGPAAFHGTFRLDLNEADQDEIKQWLRAYKEELMINCKVLRRTSNRL